MDKICVVGSMSADLTVSVPRFVCPGETIIGSEFAIYTGGKGGNQAVAASRLGAEVTMVGCLGEDANGRMYLDALKREGVNTRGLVITREAPTGVALIEVVPSGENRISIVQGSNAALSVADIENKRALIEESRLCLFQLEIRMEVVKAAMELARGAGSRIVLDPAPARPLDGDLLALCDYITPNETELAVLSGMPVDTIGEAAAAAGRLIALGARTVINKRGSGGALVVTREGYWLHDAFPVDAVDTTAAGDSFNAGFAVGLAQGWSLDEAVMLGNAVGGLSTTGKGAQAAMPAMPEAMELLRSRPPAAAGRE